MKNQVALFLRENVIGKVLYTDKAIYSLEEGRLEGEYSDKMIFSDLAETYNSIQFHMTTVAREQVYELDSDSQRKKQVKDFTGTSVFKYELAFRQSTSQLTGYMRCLSSTVTDHTMEAVVYGIHDVKLANGQLSWREKQLFYRDVPAGEGAYRSVAFDAAIRFYLTDKMLTFEYLPTYWDVNPETMEKALSKDKYPPYITKEKSIIDK